MLDNMGALMGPQKNVSQKELDHFKQAYHFGGLVPNHRFPSTYPALPRGDQKDTVGTALGMENDEL